MKKIIGIIGIAVIAMAVFFNANTMNGSNGDLDLANLIAMNIANAENTGGNGCNGNYTRSVRNYDIIITPENEERKYDEEDCTKKWCEYYTLSGWCCFYD